MLLLRALLLGGLIVFLVGGGAILFRRFFPRESPWLAFLVPPLALVLILNFIEHFLALPCLIWLLPLAVGSVFWALWKTPRALWRDLQLPGAIFAASYGFVFAVKALHPMIFNISEGIADLNRILDFCFSGTLPPIDGWCPPYAHQWYYTFSHYGASVVKRLFMLDIGTAYNFSFMLVCAWVGMAGAGAAYYISRGRVWIAWLTLFLIEAAFTGSSPLIALLSHGNPNPWLGSNLTMDWDDPAKNPFSWMLRGDRYHETLKLFPPGAWIWFDEFHPTFAGQFLTLFAVLATQIVFLPTRSNGGWICLGLLPLLAVVTATWFLPVLAVLCVGAAAVAWRSGFRPENGSMTLAVILGGAVLLWPTLAAFSTWSPHQEAALNRPEWRTPLDVFLVQWWPIYVPWLLLCFIWPGLPWAARWLHGSVALMFIGVELFNIGDWRLDTVEKMWGAIYAVGLVTLVPLVLAQRHLVFRLAGTLIVLAAAISLLGWVRNATGWIDWRTDFLHFEGDSYLVHDARKARLLQLLQQLHGATVLAGKCDWAYTEPPGLVVFSENRCYIGWSFSEDICGHAGEAEFRSQQNNDFYAGKLADPLGFLNDNRISAVLIYPTDQIPDAAVQQLRTQLASDYRYVDCRADARENAGVFLRRTIDFAAVKTPAPLLPSGSAPAP